MENETSTMGRRVLMGAVMCGGRQSFVFASKNIATMPQVLLCVGPQIHFPVPLQKTSNRNCLLIEVDTEWLYKLACGVLCFYSV